MNLPALVLADLEIDDVIGNWNRMDATTRDAILVFGALTVVTLLIVLWAAFIRKKKRTREHSQHHHHRRHRPETAADSAVVAESQQTEENPGRERRRRRRRRRDHRPRNPTLAETGGLPPIKPEGSGDLVP
jgi:hypothetical protein